MALTNEFVLSLLKTQGMTKTVEHLMTLATAQSTKFDSVKRKINKTKSRHDALKRKARFPPHETAVADFLAQQFHLPLIDTSKPRQER